MRLYEEGAVIGGTSAGAAIMTDPMLVAKHEKEAVPFPDDDKYNGVRVIKAGYMHTTGGLGFLPGAIIDQHFLKRMRQNRMFSVALDNPYLTTIGIDESTALIVSKGNRIEVMGESSVMVVRPSKKSIRTNRNNYYGARMDVRLYLEGDRFKLRTVRQQ